MKTLVLGDTHGRAFWKLVLYENDFDRLIFIGDYFDSFDINTEKQINNFLDIIEYKKKSGKEVILLIGNHDHHYFPEIGYTGTSGYQEVGKYQIEPVIDGNREHLQMAYAQDDILFTHAGVCEAWLNKQLEEIGPIHDVVPLDTAGKIADFVNDVWKHKPIEFLFTGRDSYGDDMGQTPIWIRPRSLMRSGKNLKKLVIQVVGHTGQEKIDIEGKSTGGRYYFIDTMGSSKEYLMIEDGKFSARKIFKKYDKGEV